MRASCSSSTPRRTPDGTSAPSAPARPPRSPRAARRRPRHRPIAPSSSGRDGARSPPAAAPSAERWSPSARARPRRTVAGRTSARLNTGQRALPMLGRAARHARRRRRLARPHETRARAASSDLHAPPRKAVHNRQRFHHELLRLQGARDGVEYDDALRRTSRRCGGRLRWLRMPRQVLGLDERFSIAVIHAPPRSPSTSSRPLPTAEVGRRRRRRRVLRRGDGARGGARGVALHRTRVLLRRARRRRPVGRGLRATAARWWTTATGDQYLVQPPCSRRSSRSRWTPLPPPGLRRGGAPVPTVEGAASRTDRTSSEHVTPAAQTAARAAVRAQICRPRERTGAMAPLPPSLHDSLDSETCCRRARGSDHLAAVGPRQQQMAETRCAPDRPASRRARAQNPKAAGGAHAAGAEGQPKRGAHRLRAN